MEHLKVKSAIRQNVVTNQIFLLRNYETKKTKKKKIKVDCVKMYALIK